MADKIKQWPDHITSGEIRYSPSSRLDGTGFVLRDAMHGIPVFGSVNVEVFNYPGQTEEIAKALCDRWNAYPNMTKALNDLLQIVKDMREDEEFDATTCDAGGILFGDIASEAIEQAEVLLYP